MKSPIDLRSACSMSWIRFSSGLSSTGCLSLFLLPLGRPGLRFSAGFLALRTWALALQAAFSSALRTNWVTLIGLERRDGTLIKENTKKANPGMARWNKLEKMQSLPKVASPALLTTTSSPARRYSSPGCQSNFRKHIQKSSAQGSGL